MALVGKALSWIGAMACAVLIGWLGLQGLRLLIVATDVVDTKSSPDGAVVATIERDNGGATTSYFYRVLLRQKNGDATEILSAYDTEPVALTWQSNDLLTLAMPCGKVVNFRNFFAVIDAAKQTGRDIEIKLDNSGLCAK